MSLPQVSGPLVAGASGCQPGKAAAAEHRQVAARAATLQKHDVEATAGGRDSFSGTVHEDFCVSGLNGLSACGTSGLQTGVFQVAAVQPVSYAVEETQNLFHLDNKNLLRGLVPDSFPARLTRDPVEGVKSRRFVIIDEVVFSIYGEQLEQYMQHHGVECEILPLPTCEPNKSFNLVFQIVDRLEKFRLNRRQEPIIAIGGGVCLDVAGLAANLYRRNTPVIKVPTTVMGAIDASIGIKTAVNFHGKKNKLGTYSAPLAVFIDKTFLKTLDTRHLSNGSAEILKMACIKDAKLFKLLEENATQLLRCKFQSVTASTVMRRSIQGMLEELEYNLWEHILVRLVDYGHAFSPEIEMAALVGNEARLLHGEAVNIDMALTTQLAYQRGLLSAEDRDRVYKVMLDLGLALWDEVCTVPVLMKGLHDTTLARDGQQRVPLMDGIGAAHFVNDLTEEEVAQAAAYVAKLHAEVVHHARPTHMSDHFQNAIQPLKPLPESVKKYIEKPDTALVTAEA
jgi:3-dehydroquinate synthase